MMEQTMVTREALWRAASRIGTLGDGFPAGRYLDRLLSEVDAEVRRRWQACSEDIEDRVSGYAEGSYLDWVEDADRDSEDEAQTPERRRARYATLGEWADAEEADTDEGTGFYPSYAQDIADHAEEVAGRLLVRDGDTKDLQQALEKSITDRKWEWRGIETATLVAA